MIVCPACGAEVTIEGLDQCEECGTPLADLHLPAPATQVEKRLLKDRVGVLNPKRPHTVPADMSVEDVLSRLMELGIGCLIVVEEDKPVGVFTERDALLKLNLEDDSDRRQPVSNFMTPNPETLAEDAKVAFAVHRMDLGGYRHIPIVDDSGALTGIISVRDILRYLTSLLAESA